MGGLVDLSLPTANAKIEIGTFYGGFEIGAGIMCLLFLRSQRALADGLGYQAILYLCSWVARLVGMVRFGDATTIIYFLLALEFVSFLLTYVGWKVESKRLANSSFFLVPP